MFLGTEFGVDSSDGEISSHFVGIPPSPLEWDTECPKTLQSPLTVGMHYTLCPGLLFSSDVSNVLIVLYLCSKMLALVFINEVMLNILHIFCLVEHEDVAPSIGWCVSRCGWHNWHVLHWCVPLLCLSDSFNSDTHRCCGYILFFYLLLHPIFLSWELNLMQIPVMAPCHFVVCIYLQVTLSGVPSVKKHNSPLWI